MPYPSRSVAIFAASLFAGSFLLFAVEPIIGRMVLPLLGGTPMVWNTCMMFFQSVLLAGYWFAHSGPRWFGRRTHFWVYGALLFAPLVLPFRITVASLPPTTENPIGWLLIVLAGAVGLPFFVLSTTASTLQRAFVSTGDPAARDPYFLYAASNCGSLLALLAYPTVIEPLLHLQDQRRLWTLAYAAFVPMASVCVWIAVRNGTVTVSPEAALEPVTPIPWLRRLKWIALACIPSSLLLSVTTYLTTDVATVPLFWIVPLAVYLFTFIVAFSQRGDVWRAVADRRLPLFVLAASVMILVQAVGPAWFVMPAHLAVFGLAAMLCHGELAADRPSRAQLTEFYLWIAVGGLVGGVFNTLCAPLLFNSIIEYPAGLVLASWFRRGESPQPTRRDGAIDAGTAALIAAVTAGSGVILARFGVPSRAGLLIPAFLCFSQLRSSRRFALGLAAFLVAGSIAMPYWKAWGDVLSTERTFFGVYRLGVDPGHRFYWLYHGTTLHGMQAVGAEGRMEPLLYFHRTGPFGQLWGALPRLANAPRVAVVGLGVGSLASYAGPAQHWTFYEIDPAVEQIARRSGYFTYLSRCGNRCDVVLGDARRSLANARADQYGAVVLDAFSSDAIPIHLLTTEAVRLYLSRLAPHGVLVFHVTNRHLVLGPLLARVAADHGLIALEQRQPQPPDVFATGKTSSDWVAMARDRRDLEPLIHDPRWIPPVATPSTPLWTDDFSNVLSALNIWN